MHFVLLSSYLLHCLTTLPSHCSKSFLMGSVQASRCSSERWSTIPRWATNASNSSILKLQHGGTDQSVNLKNIKIQIQIQTQIQIEESATPLTFGWKNRKLCKREVAKVSGCTGWWARIFKYIHFLSPNFEFFVEWHRFI